MEGHEIEDKIKDIIALAESMSEPAKRFYGGEKKAGTDIRKTLQKIKHESHQLRWDILNTQKSMITKR